MARKTIKSRDYPVSTSIHYAVAKNGDEETTFKQLIKDGADWYLKPPFGWFFCLYG